MVSVWVLSGVSWLLVLSWFILKYCIFTCILCCVQIDKKKTGIFRADSTWDKWRKNVLKCLNSLFQRLRFKFENSPFLWSYYKVYWRRMSTYMFVSVFRTEHCKQIVLDCINFNFSSQTDLIICVFMCCVNRLWKPRLDTFLFYELSFNVTCTQTVL